MLAAAAAAACCCALEILGAVGGAGAAGSSSSSRFCPAAACSSAASLRDASDAKAVTLCPSGQDRRSALRCTKSATTLAPPTYAKAEANSDHALRHGLWNNAAR